MAKDKIYGIIILVVAIVAAIYFTLALPVDVVVNTMAQNQGSWLPRADHFSIAGIPPIFNWEYTVAFVLYLFVIVVCVIAIWIGYQ